MVSTKDLREMCQNAVTLEDLRMFYGLDMALEDLELLLPSLLVGDLSILPCSKIAREGLPESPGESQDERKGWGTSQVENSGEASPLHASESLEENQDGREERSTSRGKNSEGALSVLSSVGEQLVGAVEPEVHWFYDPLSHAVPWHPLVALCLLLLSETYPRQYANGNLRR